MSVTTVFMRGWGKLQAILDLSRKRAWLRQVARESEKVFRAGMLGPHTGRIYRRRNGYHQASAPYSEYPANDTGALLASFRKRWSANEAQIGTNMPYSGYLREGTPHGQMARRKMSDNALKEGAAKARPHSRGIVHWTKLRNPL